MDPLMTAFVEEAVADTSSRRVRRNPGGKSFRPQTTVDILTTKVIEAGMTYEFEEKEMVEAFMALGMSKDDALDQLEVFASWL